MVSVRMGLLIAGKPAALDSRRHRNEPTQPLSSRRLAEGCGTALGRARPVCSTPGQGRSGRLPVAGPSCGPAYIGVASPEGYGNGQTFALIPLSTNTIFSDSGPLSINLPADLTIQVSPFLSDPDNCNLGASAGGDVYMNVQYVMQ